MLPKGALLEYRPEGDIFGKAIFDNDGNVVASYDETLETWILEDPLFHNYKEIVPEDIPASIRFGKPIITEQQTLYMSDYIRPMYFGTDTFGTPEQNGWSKEEVESILAFIQTKNADLPIGVKEILDAKAKQITPEMVKQHKQTTGFDHINFYDALKLTFGKIERICELEKIPDTTNKDVIDFENDIDER